MLKWAIKTGLRVNVGSDDSWISDAFEVVVPQFAQNLSSSLYLIPQLVQKRARQIEGKTNIMKTVLLAICICFSLVNTLCAQKKYTFSNEQMRNKHIRYTYTNFSSN